MEIYIKIRVERSQPRHKWVSDALCVELNMTAVQFGYCIPVHPTADEYPIK